MLTDELGYPYDPDLLPVGLLIPTRNCAPALGKHLKMLQPLLPSVREVIVVDSFSTDATYEILQRDLKHSRLRIHQKPPGLYDSWNYGIQQLSSEFTYISTVGESIDRSGLVKLLLAQAITDADVVISPPRFQTPDGSVVPDKRWPVHDLLHSRKWERSPIGQGRKAVTLDPWYVFLTSTLEAPKGLLGSSAANAYRTKSLQARPFPTEFGHFGDTAWTLRHALNLRWAFLPEMVSTFTLHESGVQMPISRLEELREKLFGVALQAADQAVSSRDAEHGAVLEPLKQFPIEFARERALRESYDRLRKAHRPWILNLETWKARAARNRQRRVLRTLESRIRSYANRSAANS